MKKVSENLVKNPILRALEETQLPLGNGTKEIVAEKVAARIAPTIDHLTNNEPWYQSRVTWGVLIAAFATMVKPFTGEIFDAQQTVEIVDAFTSGGQLFGFGLTLYGRYFAKKPLGS